MTNGTGMPEVHIASAWLFPQVTGSLPVPGPSQRLLKECESSTEEAVISLRHSEAQEWPPMRRLHVKEADICPCDLKSCNFTLEMVNL